jgi:RNA recognition motif-containing protein
MDNKLYVGNLSYQTTEADLRAMFGEAGTVEEVAIITDRDTGRSKGFGFVTMATQAEAEKAIQMFNQKPLGERVLTVNIARPREERSFGGGSSNRGRGGSNRRY